MLKTRTVKIAITISIAIGIILEHIFDSPLVSLFIILADALLVKIYEKKTGNIIYNKTSSKLLSTVIILMIALLIVLIMITGYFLLS